MKPSINLASRRHLNQVALKLFFTCAIVVLVSILALQVNSYLKNRQQVLLYQSHLDSLQGQLLGELPERLTGAQLAEQRRAYEQADTLLQRDAFRWTVLFDRMEKLLPNGVSLRSFKPDYSKNSLLINGVAKDLKDLQNLLDNLQTGRFDQVFLKNQGEVKVGDGRGGERTALSFSISLGGVF